MREPTAQVEKHELQDHTATTDPEGVFVVALVVQYGFNIPKQGIVTLLFIE